MKINITNELIDAVILLVKEAGCAIMEVYETDFDIHLKEDFSPVTTADKIANSIIDKGLKTIDKSIPILSEEGAHIVYDDRKKWDLFWLVDPLDGTKDFIKRNGEIIF